MEVRHEVEHGGAIARHGNKRFRMERDVYHFDDLVEVGPWRVIEVEEKDRGGFGVPRAGRIAFDWLVFACALTIGVYALGLVLP